VDETDRPNANGSATVEQVPVGDRAVQRAGALEAPRRRELPPLRHLRPAAHVYCIDRLTPEKTWRGKATGKRAADLRPRGPDRQGPLAIDGTRGRTAFVQRAARRALTPSGRGHLRPRCRRRAAKDFRPARAHGEVLVEGADIGAGKWASSSTAIGSSPRAAARSSWLTETMDLERLARQPHDWGISRVHTAVAQWPAANTCLTFRSGCAAYLRLKNEGGHRHLGGMRSGWHPAT